MFYAVLDGEGPSDRRHQIRGASIRDLCQTLMTRGHTDSAPPVGTAGFIIGELRHDGDQWWFSTDRGETWEAVEGTRGMRGKAPPMPPQ